MEFSMRGDCVSLSHTALRSLALIIPATPASIIPAVTRTSTRGGTPSVQKLVTCPSLNRRHLAPSGNTTRSKCCSFTHGQSVFEIGSAGRYAEAKKFVPAIARSQQGEKEVLTMNTNPVRRLANFGQSVWLDYISRHMIKDGELARRIEQDGLRGVTSNPSIFEKAIGHTHDYDEAVRGLSRQGRTAEEIYTRLAVEDVRNATDLFRPLYERSKGRHGFVSLEVSPHLAHDTDATVAEARRLWDDLDRPNAMIKVPGTREGLPAIRQLIREGINVNVTLLFGLPRYRQVVEAYLDGLQDRLADGEPVKHVASVASFFLSRIDVLVDPILEEHFNTNTEEGQLARSFYGQVAIASAKTAYQNYKHLFGSDRFRELAKHGARPQRVLWASTSTKNPDFGDIKYVEALIGPDTINTLPRETLDAYRDHGLPEARIEQGLKHAEQVFLYLPEFGIDIDEVTQQLEDEGVDKFVRPFDRLLRTLEKRRSQLGEAGGKSAAVSHVQG